MTYPTITQIAIAKNDERTMSLWLSNGTPQLSAPAITVLTWRRHRCYRCRSNKWACGLLSKIRKRMFSAPRTRGPSHLDNAPARESIHLRLFFLSVLMNGR